MYKRPNSLSGSSDSSTRTKSRSQRSQLGLKSSNSSGNSSTSRKLSFDSTEDKSSSVEMIEEAPAITKDDPSERPG